MEGLIKSLYIGFGAFLGANARYWLGGWIQDKLGSTFPWQTFIVNVSGSILIGLFLELAFRENWDPHWRLFLAIGLLGGYTTFSTFSYESLNLLGEGSYWRAAAYIAGSAILCVAGAWLGRVGARALLGG